ncbi:hypothetical protein NLM33_06400 [Bradyrhizobium sp. CCGUVB1N3]|uniref:hypothetical protein n=1 Tax=Bradyrhizobium sp. CCGUVB1N3 TaxID=2949629 RepID=UPI0020B1B62F|nr:hypothetical protein [Bradyrhizobium sp. CCGUVB1N3]MCP3469959.1 hypothetical protein [Bradyrhizobium sp. CCGUVB1N3]
MSNIVDLRRTVYFENETDIEDIVRLTELMVVMLAQPDAETALDGMHCLMGIIADKARDLRGRLVNGSRP